MPQQRFKVIFRGELAAGFTRTQVRDNLQKLCNFNAATATRMLYGQTVILKADIDQAAAERIRTAMASAGAICSVEPVEALPTATAASNPANPPDGAPSLPTDSCNATPTIAPPLAEKGDDAGGSAQLRWLFRELPKLVRAGILSEEAAVRLRLHYAAIPPPRRSSLALIICAVLGALLVGLGIILIFAHNWSEFSRPARTILSLTPLLLAQILTAWVIERKSGSIPWREGAAAFLITAIGAGIALIGQTYHLSDDLARFLLTWMLLVLPLIFLLQSTTAAALYWIGITAWAILTPYTAGTTAVFWLLLALPGWLLWQLWHRKERPLARIWLLWVLALCLIAAVSYAGQGRASRLLPTHFGLLFALYYLIDRAWMTKERTFGHRPFLLFGTFGTVFLGLALTFKSMARWSILSIPVEHSYRLFASATFSLLFVAYLLMLLYLGFRRRDLGILPFGVIGALMLLVQFAPYEWSGSVALFFNAYLLLLGGAALAAGLRQARLAKINGALAILALLLTARFFDTNLPYTVKGLAFVAVGVSFLSVNLLLRRRSQEVTA